MSENQLPHNRLNTTPLQDIFVTVQEYWDVEDFYPIEILLGAVKASQRDKIWLRIIGEGGSGKSTFLEAIGLVPNVATKVTYFTPASLKGGFKDGGKLADLVGQAKLLIVPESSEFIKVRAETRGELAAILRSVYDGETVSVFGSDAGIVKRQYDFSFFIAGIEGLRKDTILESQLGQRWIDLDWTLSSSENLPQMDRDRQLEFKQRLASKIQVLLSKASDVSEVGIADRISELANQLVPLRGYVPRNRNHQVSASPQIEYPARLNNALIALAKGIAAIHSKNSVDSSAYPYLLSVAVSSIPTVRRDVLSWMLWGVKTNEDIAKATRLDRMVVTDAREDITILLAAKGIHRGDLERTGLDEAIMKPKGLSHERWNWLIKKRSYTEAELAEFDKIIDEAIQASHDKKDEF